MATKKKFNPLTPPFDEMQDDIADLSGKSHTDLDDIGIKTHLEIDTAITNSVAHIADNSQAHSDYLLNTSDTLAGKLIIDQDANDIALDIDSESTTTNALKINSQGGSTIYALQVDTTGRSAKFTSSANDTGVNIIKLGAGGGICLIVDNDGTGNGIFLNQDGNGIALNIDSESTTQDVLNISSVATTANVFDVISNSLTSGRLARFLSDSASFSGGNGMVDINVEHASATGIALRVKNDGSGDAIKINSIAGSHINFAGDTANSSPGDGDLWFSGSELLLRIGATTYKLDRTSI